MELPQFLHVEAVGYGGLVPDRSRRALPPAFMPFDAFCRVLAQMPGLRGLHIAGAGDPMLHPRFFDMVRHANTLGVEVSAESRLTGLSEARAEACVESGLARVIVPDAPADPLLARALKRLVEARKRLGARTPEIQLPRVQAGGRCDRPWRALYLSTSCEALPCDHAHGPSRPKFGNAAKEGVVHAWNADAFRAFRERLASEAPPEACAGCALRCSPHDIGENPAWRKSAMPPKSAPSSTTAPTPTAA